MHQIHHPRVRLALATAAAAAMTGGLLTVSATTATAADSFKVTKADFNGDGIGDVLATAARRVRQRPRQQPARSSPSTAAPAPA